MSGRLVSTACLHDLRELAPASSAARSARAPCARRRADRRPAARDASSAARSPRAPIRSRGLPAACTLSSCAALRIGASGLRSSCASIARNSSLRWFTSFSASSACRRSVTSRLMPTTWRWPRVLHEPGLAVDPARAVARDAGSDIRSRRCRSVAHSSSIARTRAERPSDRCSASHCSCRSRLVDRRARDIS